MLVMFDVELPLYDMPLSRAAPPDGFAETASYQLLTAMLRRKKGYQFLHTYRHEVETVELKDTSLTAERYAKRLKFNGQLQQVKRHPC